VLRESLTRTRVFAAAALVATIVLAVQTWQRAFRAGGNDLTSYLLSARALGEGHSPYGLQTTFPYLYPLFLAFALIPLAALPYGVAVASWFAASVAALGAILRRLASGSELAIAATVLVTFDIIQNNLLNGQVNLFVVLCCVLAVAAARQGRDIASGVWLGAGIALKLMPVLLVVYLLVRRQFRAIGVAGLTAVVLALAPGLLINGSAVDVQAQYVRELLMPMMTASDGTTRYSVSSLVQRIVHVDPSLLVDVLCAAAVLGTIAAIDVRVWRPRQQDFAAGAAYLAAIILISPQSETHHLAFAIPGVALCFVPLFAKRERPAPLPALALPLSAVALLAAPFAGAAEGPTTTAAVLLLVVALSAVSGSGRVDRLGETA
jgi:alpha-1,2-mannosyltransferase